MPATPQRVISSDGVGLAVYTAGDPQADTVVAVHGYPDNHAVWDGVVDRLAGRFHAVTYDVRGAGASDKPGPRSAYRLDRLIGDLSAVVDAVSPDAPVHLLAHDWGSIQAWAALVDERLAGRVASFTSISGPSLDYGTAWLRQARKHPRATLNQLAHSYYMGLFQLPGLPELAAHNGLVDRMITISAGRTRSAAAVTGVPLRSEADRINGLALYRANLPAKLSRPQPVRTPVPVQVIAPDGDPYVTSALALESPVPWVERLTTRTVAGGHWVVSERPDVIARMTTEFIDGLHDPTPARRATAGDFGGRLVVVTGGAGGIGRATALEFARNGADVVIADIDEVAAKATAGELRELGVQAWAESLDVADRLAWADFAQRVREEHGVPDVIVNNAGIGVSGPFLATGIDDWERILGVNLWGVIHGCRLFAAQLVERGQGGHIVNIASAAAFTPSILLPAYATTKAAVLMLSECLRAELAREGIGVTAVCPGVVNSDITRNTVRLGVDEETAAAMREHQIAVFGRRNYSPEKVARQIVRAVSADEPVAVITPEAKAMRAVSRFAPGLGRRLAKVDVNRIGR